MQTININCQQNKEDDLDITFCTDSSSSSTSSSKNGESLSSRNNKKKEGFWYRIKAESKLSMSSLEDTTGQTIDIRQMLAPKPWSKYGSIKVFIFIWTLYFCINDIVKYEEYYGHCGYWVIFLSNWGISITFLCNALSLFGFLKTVYLAKQQHPRVSQGDDDSQTQDVQTNMATDNNHTFMTRLTSAVCTLAINIEVVICILYWSEVRFVTAKNIQLHGLLGAVTMIDVLVVNRMPICFKQISLVYIVTIPFAIWSIIHATTDIGHFSNDNDPLTDDDSIYPVLNWNKRPVLAATMTAFVVMVLHPVVFFTIWYLSTLLKPRYYTFEEQETGKNGDQKEMQVV